MEERIMFEQEYEMLKIYVSNLLNGLNWGDNYKLVVKDIELSKEELMYSCDTFMNVADLIYCKYRNDFKNLKLKYEINKYDFRKEIYDQLREKKNKSIVINITEWLFEDE